MINYTRNMTQTATYWAKGGNDPFGGTGFVAPVLIKCRWQNKTDLFVDQQGHERVSSAIVYPDQPLEIGGYLALGDQTANASPIGISGAYEIKNSGDSPSLDGRKRLNKVWL